METLICGGIGGGARTALAQAGIELYPGASGNADEAVDALPKDQRAGCAAPEGLDNASSGLSRNWQGCRRKNGVNSVWPGPSR